MDHMPTQWYTVFHHSIPFIQENFEEHKDSNLQQDDVPVLTFHLLLRQHHRCIKKLDSGMAKLSFNDTDTLYK